MRCVGTSDQTQTLSKNALAQILASQPSLKELKFYLKPNVELDARPSTKATLLKMIRHFFSEYKPRPLNCHKGV
ncbi:hypothetical protein PGT21_000181 [Puccinia graminis f. sp. tritici]|uniref:Uncharacterized protein n=1 Tax=Puccinia graminis f. sp. tritici TaxID=56615 RepID=A0A5B0NAU4_PUCGR|nr:hypothetical protein PGT21_000181 [Puccinia graminis f. sp. tritici]